MIDSYFFCKYMMLFLTSLFNSIIFDLTIFQYTNKTTIILDKNSSKALKVATINTFFDGISVRKMSFYTWVITHLYTFLRIRKRVRRLQLERNGPHPVEQVIQNHNPDIIVVNEVINAKWSSDSVKILKAKGYEYISIGPSPTPRNNLTRLNLVASRIEGEVEKIDIENQSGGRFCGLRIKKYNLLVIGVLASPFYPISRKEQIKKVLEYSLKVLNSNGNVIVAGDLNCEMKDLKDVHLPEKFQYITDNTFPHNNLLTALDNSFFIIRWLGKFILNLGEGQRKLDHIFIPSDANLKEYWIEETSSDHLGIIAELELKDK